MASPLPGNQPRYRGGLLVLAICFTTIIFDGYDLVVYGSTVPSIIAHKEWHIDPAGAGMIGSVALVGMLVGTLVVGTISDLFGRRKVIMACITVFSACMLATAFSPNETAFAVLRFLTGLGLGGVVPTSIALTVEYAPKSRRQMANALLMSAYSVGGVLAAVIAIAALPALDFRWLYAVGAVPLVTCLPLTYKYLPESVAYMAGRGLEEEARATAARYGLVYKDIVTEDGPSLPGTGPDTSSSRRDQSAFRELFSIRWLRSTILLSLLNFCGLLLVFGLNTWLPQIMRSAGFELGGALTFLLVLNAGAIIGSIGASWIADRIGSRKVVTASFLIACISILLLSFRLPSGLLYVVVAFTGLGSVGTQILISGFSASVYSQRVLPAALGWTLTVGRFGAIGGPIIAGFIAAMSVHWETNFYMFSAFALVGAGLVVAVPSRKNLRLEKAGDAPEADVVQPNH